MSWIFLMLATVFEVGWPIGFKITNTHTTLGVCIVVSCMLLSGFFFWLAQKSIPMGVAYAVWTSIGAAGTVAVSILFFGELYNTVKLIAIITILAGVTLLKIS